MEKTKVSLEGERDSLASDLKDNQSLLSESEKRRRTVESQLSEAQSHIAEDTAKLQEISNENERLKVSKHVHVHVHVHIHVHVHVCTCTCMYMYTEYVLIFE